MQPTSPPATKSPRVKYIAAGAVAMFAAAVFAMYHFKSAPTAPSGPAKITQISHWDKPMEGAQLSPDGHTVAFSSPVGGIEQVFVMLSSGGEPLQLTSDDGDKIREQLFHRRDRNLLRQVSPGKGEGWGVPTLGGKPTRVVSAASRGSLRRMARPSFYCEPASVPFFERTDPDSARKKSFVLAQA